MEQFFRSQLDFIYFVYGLGFFVFSCLCFIISKSGERKLPWIWLGLFSFFHALYAWLILIETSFGNNPILAIFYISCLIISLLCLVEFVRVGTCSYNRCAYSRWIFLPILAVLYLSFLAGGNNGFNFLLHYSLGFFGILGTGLFLYLYSSNISTAARKHYLKVCGVIFIFLSLTQLIIKNHPVFPNTLFDQSKFFAAFGFPVQLIRCILVLFLVFCFWIYWYFFEESSGWKIPVKTKLRNKAIIFSGAALLSVTIIGWLITQGVERGATLLMNQELLEKAQTIAAALDPRKVENLSNSSLDLDNPDYLLLKARMELIVKVNDDIRSIHLLVHRNKNIVFAIDSALPGETSYSPPGEIYTDASQELMRNFFSAEAFITQPYRDRLGQSLSFFSPVKDFKSNKIVAVVGMDVTQNYSQSVLFRYRFGGIIITLILFLILFGVFIILQFNYLALQRISSASTFLQHIIDNIPNPVHYKDRQGVYLGCNQACSEFAGLSKKEIIGKSVFDLFPPELAAEYHKMDEELFKNPGVQVYESQIVDARSIKRDVIFNKATFLNYTGKVAGLVEVMVDITESKRISDKLEQATREWQKTFDSMEDMIFLQDKDYNILKANKSFLDFFKLKSEEVIGRKCFELVHHLDHPWPVCPFTKTLCDKQTHTEEVNDPGLGIILSVTTSPIFAENGNFFGCVHIARNITQLKKYQNELESKNKELEKLDKLKSEFVSIVSHELRTPLSITKEGVSLVLDGVAGDINPQQNKILTTSKNNIDRLARIINSLLDISRIESGRMELKNKIVDLRALINSVITLFALKVKEKGLELRTDLPQNKALTLYVDEDKLIQVFTNLIDNSLKFTEKGFICISLVEKEEELEFVVSDTGIGIAAEDLPRVFNKFMQFGRTAGAGEKGTGLGLSIAKGLVELYGGKIRVESEVAKGSKFIFSLPKRSRGKTPEGL